MVLDQVCVNLEFIGRNRNVSVWVRKLVKDQAVYQNTKGPYVNWEPVGFATENLWSYISLSTTDTKTMLTIRKYFGKTKIRYDRVAKASTFIDQNIFWLYISVYNLMPV